MTPENRTRDAGSEGRSGSLARAGAISIAIKVVNVSLGLLAAMIMARILGPSVYGEYVYVFALVSIVAIPAQLGLPNLVVRETVIAKAECNPARILGVWGWAHRAVALVSLVVIALMLVLMLVFPSRDLRLTTLLWALPLVPLIALGNIRGAALRGLGKVNLGQMPEMVLRPVLFLLALVLAWLMLDSGRLGATGTIQLQGLAAAIAFGLGSLWLLRNRPSGTRPERIPADVHRRWLRASVVLGLVAGLQTFNANADLVMLGLMRENDEVGIYKIASTVGAVASFVLMSLNMVIMPRCVSLLTAGETEALQHLVRRTAQASFVAALTSILVVLVWGEFLLGLLFGANFRAAYPALLVLMSGHAVSAFFGPLTLLLNMANLERETLVGVVIGAMTNILANLLLVPHFGGLGAALATTSSILVWNVFLFLRTKKKLGINCSALLP